MDDNVCPECGLICSEYPCSRCGYEEPEEDGSVNSLGGAPNGGLVKRRVVTANDIVEICDVAWSRSK